MLGGIKFLLSGRRYAYDLRTAKLRPEFNNRKGLNMSVSLNAWNAKLMNVNLRAERHGDETVTTCDIKLKMMVGGDFLEQFDKGLKKFLFRPAEEKQLFEELADAPELRFPLMGAIPHGYRGVGYEVRFGYGVQGTDLILPDCKLNEWRFSPKSGGSVEVTFRVQCYPEVEHIGVLAGWIQAEVQISLIAPAVEAVQGELIEEEEGE